MNIPERRRWDVLGVVVVLTGLALPDGAMAAPDMQFLDVTLNGTPRHMVGHFATLPDGQLAAGSDELRDIGLDPGSAGSDAIALSQLPGVTYTVDSARQTICIQAPPETLATAQLDLGALRGTLPADVAKPGAAFGTLLNYDLYAASYSDLRERTFSFDGISSTLEGAAFSPFGGLSLSGIVGQTTVSNGYAALRLDTTYEYDDGDRAEVYRAGDTISGGLLWTRPIRLGGLQMQKDYALRPDIVTLPLPSVSGTAAVPSALNVYVNGVQTFTGSVAAGPYAVTNIPILTGTGTTRVVLQDASGRQTQEDIPYFATPKLLRAGLYDYSVEAGFPRLDYGLSSFAYAPHLAGSASGRYGVTDWLTLEAHGEATSGFGNLGFGSDVRTGTFGVLSGALAGSLDRGARGGLGYGSYEVQAFGLSMSLDTQRSFERYRDLAAVTAPCIDHSAGSLLPAARALGFFDFGSILPPLAIDRLSVSLPIPTWKSSLNASVLDYDQADHVRSRIASASYTKQIASASVFATILHDFDNARGSAVLGGLSMPLGSDISASTLASAGGDGTRLITQVSKTSNQAPGSYGWNISDGEGQNAYRNAEIDYQAPLARLNAQATQAGTGVGGSLEVNGALVAMPGADLHMGPRIDDSFAIVKAGAPNVPVEYQNRPIGVTGSDGELLVTVLHANDRNTLAIDPTNLPATASVERTKTVFNPASKTGAIIDFGVDASSRSATVRFVDRDGRDIEAGSEGVLGSERFVVGYDGLAYFKTMKAGTVATIHRATSDCEAVMPEEPNGVPIGPIACLPSDVQQAGPGSASERALDRQRFAAHL